MDHEDHRHRCEVRQLLRWTVQRGGPWVHAWLYGAGTGRDRVRGVADFRGREAADRLRDDARAQWRLGNRGADGDWR